MPTETVIIRGRDLDVERQTGDENEPLRRRPPAYTAAESDGVDLAETIRQAGLDNPYWTAEANDWADAHPDIKPNAAARKWRKHRIETP